MREVNPVSPEETIKCFIETHFLPCRRRLHGAIDIVKFAVAAPPREAKDKNQKAGSLIQGHDMSGSIARVMTKLAHAKVNVTAVDAVTAGAGRFGAILRVKQRDVNRATRALGA